MPRLKLAQRRLYQDDHIHVRIRLGYQVGAGRSFTDNLMEMLEEVSAQVPAAATANEDLAIKIINFEEDGGDTGDTNAGRVELAIPTAATPAAHGLPLVLAIASFASVFSNVTQYQILDIDFPESHLAQFPGPSFGSDYIAAAHNGKRVQLGLVLRPRFGGDRDALYRYVGDFAAEGIDFIIDDELTVLEPGSEFENRVARISAAVCSPSNCAIRSK